jgi:hypothetical protein
MRAKGDGKLPPWIGDDDAMRAWINGELDRWDHEEFYRPLIKAVNHWLRSQPPRSKAESRKRHLILGKRAAAAHRALMTKRAIEESDIETLRRLYPEHAQFIHAPKNSKRGPKKTVNHDPDSPERRLADAREEARRIRIILKKHYGRSNRPSGALTVEEIAAERWGLTEADVRKQRVSRKRRR